MKKQVKKELLWLCGLGALALYASKNRKAALLPALAAGYLAVQKTEEDSFRFQSVVITGGSRGLGLALAQELVTEGANVTLLARDGEELERAHSLLKKIRNDQVQTIVCDVTNTVSLQEALLQAASRFGGIDMLINNAGAIVVGPWETMERADYEAQMNLHLYAPMNAIQLSLPYLRKSSSGKRIVNICSLGGRVPAPHMLPYDTSKFALSGFSQGLTAELASEKISVTTIYPTLMRTGSPIQAVFTGNQEKEFAWFQSGDVLPFLSMPADVAAKKIVQAARERRWELMPTSLGRLRMLAASFFPELLGEMMVFLSSMMPKGTSNVHKTGAQSRKLFDDSLVTKPLISAAHSAEEKWNQRPRS